MVSVRTLRNNGDVKVLSFAAVAIHGREWWARQASRVLCWWLAAMPILAQSPPKQDLAADLAAKIATLVAAGAAGAAGASGESVQIGAAGDDGRVRDEVTRQLRSRGVRIVARDAAVVIQIGCAENLRDRVCTADVHRGGQVQTAVAAVPREARPRNEPVVALRLESIVAQRDPLLDVAAAGDQLLVLEPSRVKLVPRDERAAAASSGAAVPISASRPWPRDLRGRIRATPAGFDVHLPGVTCRGTVSPLAMVCADENEPWPLGIANTGIVAGRNYFTTPEGLPFYGAAPLGGGAAAGWLVVDQQGRLTRLDSMRAVTARTDSVDDIARVETTCTSGPYAVASTAASPGVADNAGDNADVDALRLLAIRDSVPAAIQTLRTPGRVTALWADAESTAATAIVRYPGGARYEAFRVSLSCAR